MHMFHDATIDCDAATREMYEWARDEFKMERDPDTGELRRKLDDKGLPIPINPIRFPLKGALITHTGNRTMISIPQPAGEMYPQGRPHLRLDTLVKSAAPTRASKGDKEIWTLAGQSERMYRQGVSPEHAQVSFTISKFAASHLPNQQLEVVPATSAR